MPEVFNVATFDNNDNVRNVYRSKAVGEPPLMLGIAVWAAVKNALSYVAPGSPTDLQLPATGEEILRCLTQLGVGCQVSGVSRQRLALTPDP